MALVRQAKGIYIGIYIARKRAAHLYRKMRSERENNRRNEGNETRGGFRALYTTGEVCATLVREREEQDIT